MAGPMREPTFWILSALARAPRHGYAVIQEAAHLSGGRVTRQPGTPYAATAQLAARRRFGLGPSVAGRFAW